MAQYLLHSGDFEFETDSKKIAKRMLEDVKSDPHYWTWNEEKE
jgi:tRNA G46 methylase TrmB